MDIGSPDTAWIGLLDALGIVFVFVLWLLLRDGSDRVRALAAMVGATLLAIKFSTAVSVLPGLASRLAVSSRFGSADDDNVRNFVIALAGLVVGLVVALAGHRRTALVEDVDDEPMIEAEPLLIVGTAEVIENGNHDDYDDDLDDLDDEDEDDYLPQPRDLSRWAAWFDVAALALAVALPSASLSSLFSRTFEANGDVTVMLALSHVLAGLVAAGAFLVLLGHREIDDVRLLAAAFGLVVIGAAIGPVFPEAMANEVWLMIQVGLAAGLLAGVSWALIRPAVTADRLTAACAVVITIVVLGLLTVVSTRVFIEQQEAQQNEFLQTFDES